MNTCNEDPDSEAFRRRIAVVGFHTFTVWQVHDGKIRSQTQVSSFQNAPSCDIAGWRLSLLIRSFFVR